MTQEDKEFLNRISAYAEKKCRDLDPKKTKSSVQLDRLMPIFHKIAEENGQNVEDVFVRYMDLSMEQAMTQAKEKTADVLDIPDGELS